MFNNLSYPFRDYYINNGIAVLGWAFSDNGKYLNEEQLSNVFTSVNNEADFKKLLSSLNGNFAAIINNENFQAAAVDHIRSIPIVYSVEESKLNILSNFSLDDKTIINKDQFQNCWCVLGNETLLKDTYELQAGQYVWLDELSDCKPKFYFYHYKRDKVTQVEEKKAIAVFENMITRYLSLLKNKTAVIPLSGGYDSRLLLSLLVKHQHKNIIAFTYGNLESHETKIAKQIAEKLGIKWHFVNYDEDLFKQFFTENWEQYSHQNHFFTSLPHEQDFFAIHYLREKKWLPQNSVFLPGFSGDLLGGSITNYQPSAFTTQEWNRFLKKKHFQNQDIVNHYQPEIYSKKEFYDYYQHWFVCNKVSKFIINSVRVYEYFGYQWLLPFWDKNLIEFWYSLPYHLREKQFFYNEILFKYYFEPLGIALKKPAFDDNYPNAIKEKIKDWIPNKAQKIIKSVKGNRIKEAANLHILNKMIENELSKRSGTEINNTHASYFLEIARKKAL